MGEEGHHHRRRSGGLLSDLLPWQTSAAPESTPAAPVAKPAAAEPRDLESVIGDCAYYEDGKRRPGRLTLAEAHSVAQTSPGFVWIGMQGPTPGEVEAVAREFGLPALAVQDAVRAHQRPKIEAYGDVLFVVLKPVRYVDFDEVIDVAEVAIFIGPSFVVTVRHGESDVLRHLRADLDAGTAELIEHTPVGLLHRAMDKVCEGYEATLVFIDEDVDQVESEVFSGSTDDHSERIYKLKREVAEFRRAVLPLAPAVERLGSVGVVGVREDSLPYFRDVHDHVLRSAEAIEGHDRLLSDILQADLARVAVRQSEIALRQNEIAMRQNSDMRRISAWAAIALVPTAIAGIYGMNFEYMPELQWDFGYFTVLGTIATVCGLLYRAFRRNGWL